MGTRGAAWRRGAILASAVGVGSLLTTAGGQVPSVVDYQSSLADAQGSPVSGQRTIVFALYPAAANGEALWTETQTVTVQDGTYSTGLGSITPFPEGVWDTAQLWLGVRAGTDPEMAPRTRIVAVPYALKSRHAETASQALRAAQADHAASADAAVTSDRATSAQNAVRSESAALADRATEADHATAADSASNSDQAGNAQHAVRADSAATADQAIEAGHAASADAATHAQTATTAQAMASGAAVPPGAMVVSRNAAGRSGAARPYWSGPLTQGEAYTTREPTHGPIWHVCRALLVEVRRPSGQGRGWSSGAETARTPAASTTRPRTSASSTCTADLEGGWSMAIRSSSAPLPPTGSAAAVASRPTHLFGSASGTALTQGQVCRGLIHACGLGLLTQLQTYGCLLLVAVWGLAAQAEPGRFGGAVGVVSSPAATGRHFMGRGLVGPTSLIEVLTQTGAGVRQDSDGDGIPDVLDPDDDNDGISDEVEIGTTHTSPDLADTDGDTMPDDWELTNGFDPLDPADGTEDADHDGATNAREFASHTFPRQADSDADTMHDGWELAHGLDPRDPGDAGLDPDRDGLTNADEALVGTDPWDPDSDLDDMEDGWEVTESFDPLLAADADEDADGDGFTNRDEFLLGTDPHRYRLHLRQGWNLFAIGRKPRDNRVSAVFGGHVWPPIRGWDGHQYVASAELLPQQGYWVFAPEEVEIDVLLP